MDLVNGTIENVIVDLLDRSGAVTDLSTASPEFSVENYEGDVVQDPIAATAIDMRVTCLLDTTATDPGPWENGVHKLYVSFTIGSETPKVLAGTFTLI